jgi:YgiT-type zinc finger domain-containing protein
MAKKEDAVMPFRKCPVCGGDVVRKRTEKLLRGGVNLATMTVAAEVCLHCGERLYSPDTIRSFEQIRSKLNRQQVAEFEPIGRSFRVPV